MEPITDPIPPKSIRIMIVDDHPVVRQGLVMTLNREPGWKVCWEAESLQEARNLLSRDQPDMILLDLDLQGSSGLDLIKEVKQSHPQIPVIVLSAHDEDLYAERALRAGSRGYLMKSERPERMVAAIHSVLDGQMAMSEKLKAKLLENMVGNRDGKPGFPMDRLTDRELEVFRMVGAGMPTKGIAEKLSVSIKTVEAHFAHIKQKLGLQSGVELQRHAFHWTTGSGKDPV